MSQVRGSPNITVTSTHTAGVTAGKVLERNKKRAGYRVLAALANVDNIYHGHNSRVSTSNLDIIAPGGTLEDVGDWDTIFRGEVWLISGAAAQTVTVEEIIKVN